jgi:hypothetical protein
MTRSLLLALAPLALLLAACDLTDDDDPSPTGDFDAFRNLVLRAGDIDYEPLKSPAEAVQSADVIVLGEITGAKLATATLDAASNRETRYVILTVAVRTVLAGALPEPAGEVVYVSLRVGGIDPAKEIEELVPRTRALLVLDDWQPSGKLDGFPTHTFAPYPDGAWFETGDTFEGLWVTREEVEQRWGETFGSLDDLASLLETTANQ